MPLLATVPSHEEAARAFYPRLEALRGVAALSVAVGHTWLAGWFISARGGNVFVQTDDGTVAAHIVSSALRIFGNGAGAVVLFFVLSGFVLTGALVRLPRYSGSGATQFIVSRLFRIYPAVFATMAIFAALLLANGAIGAGILSFC